MAGRTHRIARYLGGLLPPADAGADADLLGRFVADRDEAAFTVLVRRHGPMVHGVCRRVLRDAHGADDAFQATFLVLARRAGSLRRRGLLANWLYGVAYRTALEARRAGAVRRAKESRAAAMKEWTVGPDDGAPDLRDALDRELAALPEMYRAAVVLCDLEGLPRAEAAGRLGWTEGTLSGRLARARALLAKRLAKCGLSAAGVAAAAGAAEGLAPALVETTARAAVLTAVGQSVAGVVPVTVLELSQGVMKAMYMTKLKGLVAVVMVAGAVAWTGAVGTLSEAAAGPQDQPAAKGKKATRDSEADRIAQLEKERDELRKQLVDLRNRMQAMEEAHAQARERELAARRQAEFALAAERTAREQEAKAQRNVRNFLDQMVRPSPEPALAAPTPITPSSALPPQATPSLLGPSSSPPVSSVPSSNALPPLPVPSTNQPRSSLPSTSGLQPALTIPPVAGPSMVLRVYPVDDLAADEKQAEAVVRIIQAMVEPRTWQNLGGEGVIEYFAAKKTLVVRQAPEVHKQLTELLELLRAKPTSPPRPGVK